MNQSPAAADTWSVDTSFQGYPMRRMLIGFVVLSTVVAAPAFACGPGGTTRGGGVAYAPPLAALLDAELTRAKLDDAEMAKLKAMRAEIATLKSEKKMTAAREVEEKAMLILGYRKAWTACGPGSFLWMKLPSKTS
jgi:hypothetical protein